MGPIARVDDGLFLLFSSQLTACIGWFVLHAPGTCITQRVAFGFRHGLKDETYGNTPTKDKTKRRHTLLNLAEHTLQENGELGSLGVGLFDSHACLGTCSLLFLMRPSFRDWKSNGSQASNVLHGGIEPGISVARCI